MTRLTEILEEAVETSERKSSEYASSYYISGSVMHSLFPSGLVLSTEEDWTRINIVMQLVSKLTRYCVNFNKGGHLDSMHDSIVYAAILQEIDETLNKQKELKENFS